MPVFAGDGDWNAQIEKSRLLFESNKFAAADEHLKKALLQVESSSLSGEKLAYALNQVASVYAYQAVVVLEMQTVLPGNKDKKAVALQYNARAIELLKRSLALLESSAPGNKIKAAEILHQLGRIAARSHRYEEAEGYYKRALSVYESSPVTTEEMKITLANYAKLLRLMGRDKEAEALMSGGRVVREKQEKNLPVTPMLKDLNLPTHALE